MEYSDDHRKLSMGLRLLNLFLTQFEGPLGFTLMCAGVLGAFICSVLWVRRGKKLYLFVALVCVILAVGIFLLRSFEATFYGMPGFRSPHYMVH